MRLMCVKTRGFVSRARKTRLVWRWRPSWLACYTVREGRFISFIKDPRHLDKVAHPLEYFHSAILLYMQYVL